MSKAKALAASVLTLGLLIGAPASQASDESQVTPVTSASQEYIQRISAYMMWMNFFLNKHYIQMPVVTQPLPPNRPEGTN